MTNPDSLLRGLLEMEKFNRPARVFNQFNQALKSAQPCNEEQIITRIEQPVPQASKDAQPEPQLEAA